MSRLAIKTVMAVLGILAVSSQVRAGTVLITEQEASLPPERIAASPRAITRGPRIELVQPDATANSPMHFQLKFQSFGGSEINTGSLHVFYLRMPEVDITPRVARFTQPTGIDIPDAEVPTGEHTFRVEIADSEGRTRSSIFTLKIAP
jgi:hypothetical protein